MTQKPTSIVEILMMKTYEAPGFVILNIVLMMRQIVYMDARGFKQQPVSQSVQLTMMVLQQLFLPLKGQAVAQI